MQRHNEIVPKMIFIIPYRDREAEFELFINKMDEILFHVDKSTYYYLFIHQCDERDFCRGGLKNIGFLVVKDIYPESYLDITLIFNDIDTYPSTMNLITDYTTKRGIIKHFYGYNFALGGILSITCHDFEKINGFPNYWGWGFEDNMLNRRALSANIVIDRSQFYRIDDKRIIQINSTPLRTVNKIEFNRYLALNEEGIHSIHNLQYTIDDTDTPEKDQHITEETGTDPDTDTDTDPDDTILFVNVTNFQTEYECNQQYNSVYDTRNKKPPFNVGVSNKRFAQMGLIIL